MQDDTSLEETDRSWFPHDLGGSCTVDTNIPAKAMSGGRVIDSEGDLAEFT